MEKLITKFNNINKDECFIDLNIFLDEIIRGDHELIKHMLYRFSNDVVFIETLKSYSYRIIKTLLIKNDDILFYNIIKWMIKHNFYIDTNCIKSIIFFGKDFIIETLYENNIIKDELIDYYIDFIDTSIELLMNEYKEIDDINILTYISKLCKIYRFLNDLKK